MMEHQRWVCRDNIRTIPCQVLVGSMIGDILPWWWLETIWPKVWQVQVRIFLEIWRNIIVRGRSYNRYCVIGWDIQSGVVPVYCASYVSWKLLTMSHMFLIKFGSTYSCNIVGDIQDNCLSILIFWHCQIQFKIFTILFPILISTFFTDLLFHVPISLLRVPHSVQWNFGKDDNGMWTRRSVQTSRIRIAGISERILPFGKYCYKNFNVIFSYIYLFFSLVSLYMFLFTHSCFILSLCRSSAVWLVHSEDFSLLDSRERLR